ncbi:MAG: S-adenosylmethionine:tRNA ribosyltransferase-isomerase [Pseudonocardiaceae bacterium]
MRPRALDFMLPAELEAHEPPEARGLARDGVRLLVGSNSTGELSHHRFAELPDLLRPGDVLVVNTSATLPAAVPVLDSDLTVHFSTELPAGTWLIELREAARKATAPHSGGAPGTRYALLGGGSLALRERFFDERLWVAEVDTGRASSVQEYLYLFGAPIRYGYLRRPWPLSYYQTVFATHPGSAEMPSASRPFTDRMVSRLVTAGVQVVPVLLHTGVASPEAHERPYPERFAVPATSARIVNQAKTAGMRIIAAGTTVVRALESATSPDGVVGPDQGWTDLIITPERGTRVVDGLLTGLHEPRASHLDMLAAIAGPDVLDQSYAEAIELGYLWHEFGDVNLLLP